MARRRGNDPEKKKRKEEEERRERERRLADQLAGRPFEAQSTFLQPLDFEAEALAQVEAVPEIVRQARAAYGQREGVSLREAIRRALRPDRSKQPISPHDFADQVARAGVERITPPASEIERLLAPYEQQVNIARHGIPRARAMLQAPVALAEEAGRIGEQIVADIPEPVREAIRERVAQPLARQLIEGARGTEPILPGMPEVTENALSRTLERMRANIAARLARRAGVPEEEFADLDPGGWGTSLLVDALLTAPISYARIPRYLRPLAYGAEGALLEAALPWPGFEDEPTGRAMGYAFLGGALLGGASERALGRMLAGVTDQVTHAVSAARSAMNEAEADRIVTQAVQELKDLAAFARQRGKEDAARVIEREMVRVAMLVPEPSLLGRALLRARDVGGVASVAGLGALAGRAMAAPSVALTEEEGSEPTMTDETAAPLIAMAALLGLRGARRLTNEQVSGLLAYINTRLGSASPERQADLLRTRATLEAVAAERGIPVPEPGGPVPEIGVSRLPHTGEQIGISGPPETWDIDQIMMALREPSVYEDEGVLTRIAREMERRLGYDETTRRGPIPLRLFDRERPAGMATEPTAIEPRWPEPLVWSRSQLDPEVAAQFTAKALDEMTPEDRRFELIRFIGRAIDRLRREGAPLRRFVGRDVVSEFADELIQQTGRPVPRPLVAALPQLSIDDLARLREIAAQRWERGTAAGESILRTEELYDYIIEELRRRGHQVSVRRAPDMGRAERRAELERAIDAALAEAGRGPGPMAFGAAGAGAGLAAGEGEADRAEMSPGVLGALAAGGLAGYLIGRGRGALERRALARAANVDALTGLANQRAYHAARATADADPNVEHVLIDLQNLKAVNDHLGMDAGNAEIQKAAAAVRQAAREVLDTDERVFRIGGDEFAVLASKGQGEQVVRRAQELFQGVEAGGFRTGLRGAVGETFEQADEGVRRLKAGEGPRYRGGVAPAAIGLAAGAAAAAGAEGEGEEFPALAATLAAMGVPADRRFYSRLLRRIEAGPNRATAQQWRRHLEQGVSAAEREWTGVQALLDRLDPNARLTKDEILDVFSEGEIRLGERVFGGIAPEVKVAQQEAEAAQRHLDEVRARVADVMRRAGYSDNRIASWLSYPPYQPPAPVPAEVRERYLESARAFHRLIEENDNFGFESAPRAVEAILAHPDPIRAFNLPEEIRPEIERHKAIWREWYEAGQRPAPPEVAAALDELRAAIARLGQAQRDLDVARFAADMPMYGRYTEPGGENYREILITLDRPGPYADLFRTAHWRGVPNVVAHTRVKDRVTPDGQRALHVEEIQSDWAQRGREHGYRSERDRLEARYAEINKELNSLYDELPEQTERKLRILEAIERGTAAPNAEQVAARTDDRIREINQRIGALMQEEEGLRRQINRLERAVPDMPFRRTEDWTSLVAKRMIDEAARGQYDAITWSPGRVQADRYNLRHYVGRLVYDRRLGVLYGYDEFGNVVITESGVSPEQLADYIGKELAEQLLRNEAPIIDVIPVEEWVDRYGYDPHGSSLRDRANDRWMVVEIHPDGRNMSYLNYFPTKEEARRWADEHTRALGPGRRYVLEGEGLEIGGEGMIEFYDKILPSTLRKYAKQLGVDLKIEPIRVDIGGTYEERPGFRITDELRRKVLEEGQPLLGVAGLAAGAALSPEEHESVEGNIGKAMGLGPVGMVVALGKYGTFGGRVTPETIRRIVRQGRPMAEVFEELRRVADPKLRKHLDEVDRIYNEIATPDRIERLTRMAQQGLAEGARGWYENSAEAFVRHFPDPAEREIMVDLVAHFSAMQEVGKDLADALIVRAARDMGIPIDALRVGGAAGARAEKIVERIFQHRGVDGPAARKIVEFAAALNTAKRDPFQHFIVLDTHMERAFGLPKGTFGSGGRKNEAHYDAAERVIVEIANRLGERPEDVQAAIWHVQRSLPQGRSLGVAPPGNYATLLDRASTWAEQTLFRQKDRPTLGVRVYLERLAEVLGGEADVRAVKTPEEAAEIVTRITHATDGATFNVRHGNMAGKPYYAVAVYPQLGEVVDGPPTREQIEEFVRKHWSLLQQPENSIGTWYNKADGKTYLDISRTVPSVDKALELGKKHRQIAIFDLNRFEEIPVEGGAQSPLPLPAWMVGFATTYGAMSALEGEGEEGAAAAAAAGGAVPLLRGRTTLAGTLGRRLGRRIEPHAPGGPLAQLAAREQAQLAEAILQGRVPGLVGVGRTRADVERFLRRMPYGQFRALMEAAFPEQAIPEPFPSSALARQGYPLGEEFHAPLPTSGEFVHSRPKDLGITTGAFFQDPYARRGGEVLVKAAGDYQNPEAEALVDEINRRLFRGLVPTYESEVLRGQRAMELVEQVPHPDVRAEMEEAAFGEGLYMRPLLPLRDFDFPSSPSEAEVADALRAGLIGRVVQNEDLHIGNIVPFEGGRAGAIDAGLAFAERGRDPLLYFDPHSSGIFPAAELLRDIIVGDRAYYPSFYPHSVDVEAALRPLADRVRNLDQAEIDDLVRRAQDAAESWVELGRFYGFGDVVEARDTFKNRLVELPNTVEQIVQAWSEARRHTPGSETRREIYRDMKAAVRASAPVLAGLVLADGFMDNEELREAHTAGLTGIIASLLPARARRKFLGEVMRRTETAADRVLRHIDYGDLPRGPREALSYQMLKAYTYVLDRLAPIERVTTEAARALGYQERRGPLSRLLRGPEKGRERLPIRLDAETMARAAQGWQGYAAEIMDRGIHLPGDVGEARTRGLNQILAEVGSMSDVKLGIGTYKAHQALDAYRAAKRALELADPARPGGVRETGFDLDAAREIVREIETNYPDIVRLQRELVAYHDEWIRLLESEGILKPGALEQMKAAGNDEYMPLFRAGHETVGPTVGGKRLADLPDPIKRLMGSQRKVVSPTESDIRLTYAHANLLMRHRVSQALAEIAEAWEDNPWIRRTRRPMRKVTFSKEQLKGQIDDDFLELIEPEYLDIWTGRRPSSGEHTFSVLREGKRAYYQADPLLYEAVMGLTPHQMGFFAKLLAAPAQWLRTGVTILPDFALANLIRDTVQVAATAKSLGPAPLAMARAVGDMLRGLATLMAGQETSTLRRTVKAAIPGAAWGALAPSGIGESEQEAKIRGMGALLGAAATGGFGALAPQIARGFTRRARSRPSARMKPEDIVSAWRSAGGDFAAYLSMDRNAIADAIREARRQGQRFPIAWTPADAIRALRAMNEVMENANRMGEFLRQLDQAGATTASILRGAVAARDVSVDFKRHGLSRAIEVLRPMAAFWNARIQGLDKIRREFVKNPRRTSAVLLTSVTLPSIGLWLINRENPDYWEIPLWQRNAFWFVPIGETTLDDGTSQTVFLRIPKPFELGLLFGSLPERLIEAFDPLNPHRGGAAQIEEQAWEQFVGTAADMFAPIPTAVQPWLEMWMNRDLFTGRTIHSIFEPEDLDPRLKGRARASETARLFSDVLNDAVDATDHTPVVRQFAEYFRLSPAEVDHVFYSYLGGAGRLALRAGDRLLRDVETRGEAPAGQLGEAPLTGRFLARVPPPTSESEAQFSELWRRAQGLQRSVDRWIALGEVDRALSLIEREPALFAIYNTLRGTANFLSKQREYERQIEESPGLSAQEKRRALDLIYRQNAEAAKAALDAYRMQLEAEGWLSSPARAAPQPATTQETRTTRTRR